MTENEALEILRAQGYAVGAPDEITGQVRVWMHGSDRMIEVDRGRELVYLAEGKITFDEVMELHQEAEQSVG